MDSEFDISRRGFLSSMAVVGASTALSALSYVAPQAVAAAEAIHPRKRRIGYVVSSEQFRVEDLVRFGAAADKAGFDAVWSSDHFQPWQANEGHSSFAWATLAALTQRSHHVMLGTGVTCPSYRYRPAIVAEAFATLGQLAPGRVFLGVGTGEALNEQASGSGWGKYPERAERMVEAIKIIRKLWTGETISHKGKYWQIDKARLYDLPSQPVPIYVAANGPKSARLAGEHGDGWITDLKGLQDKEMRKAFEDGARAAGKDPAQLEIVLESFVVAGSMEEARKGAELWRFTKKSWKPGYVTNPDPVDIQRRADSEIPLESVYQDWPVGTDPQIHIDALRKMWDAGAGLVFVHSPQTDQMAFIDWYSKNVLPKAR